MASLFSLTEFSRLVLVKLVDFFLALADGLKDVFVGRVDVQADHVRVVFTLLRRCSRLSGPLVHQFEDVVARC